MAANETAPPTSEDTTRATPAERREFAPFVSVIVPTRNSAQTLKRCLLSIQAQTYPNLEIIVVDNYSEDRTEEIARSLADGFARCGPERSAQRNHGAKISRGEFLLFIDTDMELTSRVVESCIKCSASCDAVIIPEKSIGLNRTARTRSIERNSYNGSFLFEAARFIRKEAFEALDGYDTRLTGLEDYDLEARLEEGGYRVGHSGEFILHHEEELNVRLLLRKRVYYAQGLDLYRRLHPNRAKNQFGFARILCYARCLKSSPIAFVQVLALKTVEYAFVRACSLGLIREAQVIMVPGTREG